MAKLTFTVILERDEDGFYVADVPALKSCHTQGKTMEEAMANIREVIALCLEEQKDSAEQMEFVGVHRIELNV